jgi:hypothetical protein
MPHALNSEEGHAFDPAELIAVVGMGMRVVILFVRNTSSLPAGIELMVRGLVSRP